jgi:hypothetical protein
MANETIITVIGNLTDAPELRYTPNGLAVANFTIASTPRTLDRASNEWKDGEALFLRASVWKEYAEHVASTLTKGSRVIAQGPQAAFLRDQGRGEADQHGARDRRDRPLAQVRHRTGHPRHRLPRERWRTAAGRLPGSRRRRMGGRPEHALLAMYFHEIDENVDPRIGAPDCVCGHSTMRHHGSERTLSGAGWRLGGDWTACKDCTFCDYYKADLRRRT